VNSSDHVLFCRGVTVGYGSEIVLDRIDLTIRRGGFVALVGPNGGGKSTLIRAMLGLVPLRAGELRRDFGDRPAGYVPQQKQLDAFYPVSLRQLVEMGLYPELGVLRRASSTQRDRVDALLARFGLAAHQNKTYAELSGGMRQKALVARALALRPQVLVLDEPAAGLDAAAEEELMGLLRRLHREEGTTVILAHHRLEDLERLGAAVCRIDGHTARWEKGGSHAGNLL